MANLLWTEPDYSTVPLRKQSLDVRVHYRASGQRLRKGLAFTHRNQAVMVCKRLGLAISKRWSGYHQRASVKAMKNCFKRLSEKVMARAFEQQVAGPIIRASTLHRFTKLSTP